MKHIERVTSEKSETNPESLNSALIIKSIADLVWHLKNQGCSLEEIAKKLNKGKTEIDLLLKFQEESKE